jgi:hypothetical protein
MAASFAEMVSSFAEMAPSFAEMASGLTMDGETMVTKKSALVD